MPGEVAGLAAQIGGEHVVETGDVRTLRERGGVGTEGGLFVENEEAGVREGEGLQIPVQPPALVRMGAGKAGLEGAVLLGEVGDRYRGGVRAGIGGGGAAGQRGADRSGVLKGRPEAGRSGAQAPGDRGDGNERGTDSPFAVAT